MRIIMGADVSSNNEKNGYAEYIAIILCTEESMNRNYKKIGMTDIHMVYLKYPKKKKITQNLKFNNIDFIGLCLYVSKGKTIKSILTDPKFVSNIPKHKLKDRLEKHFDHLLFQKISCIIKPFVASRKFEIKDIVMQCDSDMSKTGKNWHMKITEKGKAHEIADVLAWCNGHNMDIKCSIERDLAVEIYQEMKREFIK